MQQCRKCHQRIFCRCLEIAGKQSANHQTSLFHRTWDSLTCTETFLLVECAQSSFNSIVTLYSHIPSVRNIRKSWSISESPGNNALFVIWSQFRHTYWNKYQHPWFNANLSVYDSLTLARDETDCKRILLSATITEQIHRNIMLNLVPVYSFVL